jgi:CRISPR system Cascade subunit CasB
MTWSPTSRELGFAGWLAELKKREDRATLAALRRGLMLEEAQLFTLYSHIPPHFLASLKPGEERVYLMVAALFAYHPLSFPDEVVKERRLNLGDSLRRLALAKQKPGEGSDPEDPLPEALKRRMEALLAAHRSELFDHLRQVISLLKAEEIPVDWACLLADLKAWEWDGHPVQWRWSRSFYVGHHDEGGEEAHVS